MLSRVMEMKPLRVEELENKTMKHEKLGEKAGIEKGELSMSKLLVKWLKLSE